MLDGVKEFSGGKRTLVEVPISQDQVAALLGVSRILKEAFQNGRR
jgi:hypothetical protein